jgi:hypothetical protein
MAERRELENALLAEIREHIERTSEAQLRLARQHGILTRAATQLRLGRGADFVLAEIREHSPDLLRDHLEARPGLASGSIGSTSPVEASA